MMTAYFSLRRLCGAGLLVVAAASALYVHHQQTAAANITSYRDTLSTSAPEYYANHTLEFTIATAIPPGGYVRMSPSPGDFEIPTTNFSTNNVDLAVSTSSGYMLRQSTTTADAVYDGVSITTGTSGQVEVTLNSTEGIPAGARIRMRIGTHTYQASSTIDQGIKNPSALGTYPIYIEYGGGTPGSARPLVAIVDRVTVGPADTREFIPPVRFNGAPTGELSGTITSVEVSFETDEFADCRYATTPGVAFLSMGLIVTNTGSIFHSFVVGGLQNDTTYSYYIRCVDDEGNINTDDYLIEFTIPEAPEGEPGNGEEGSDGDDDGTGTGSTGSGSGSSSGNTGSNQSGSGGSSGGGGGGGGTNDDDLPYESGDGRLTITGYAFPNSTVTVLVDGDVAQSERAQGNGTFTIVIDEIARGVYNFGLYATDSRNVKSTTFTTTFTIAGARGSTLSNVTLMPTVSVSPARVEPGTPVTFSGYAVPNSTINIETRADSGGSATLNTTTSDSSGFWTLQQSTNGFARGTWKVRARSTQTAGPTSNFSGYTYYGIGADAQQPTSTSDLNRDGKVNLIDFSILLFHWNTSGGNSNPPADINRDGRVSLTDFSIMIFNWTG